MVIKRFSVYLINLDPTIGSEIKKTRPCVVISPDEMNNNLPIVIVAPLTSTAKKWPTRVDTKFKGKSGQIALEQLRSLSVDRFVKKLGDLDNKTSKRASEILQEMFEF